MSLADQIIEHGPFMAGEVQPDWMRWPKAVDYNALRDELIEGRRLRAAAEARERFTAAGIWHNDATAGLELRCDRCQWYAEADDDEMSLAELVRRADGHTEGCR